MARAFILLMDSFGIGAASDADKYGDVGANTFGHIAEFCAAGKADREGLRAGPLQIPNLVKLGLHAATIASTGKPITGLSRDVPIEAAFGFAAEQSLGKDTPSGHWEIAGVPVLFDWGYFPPEYPSFPAELVEAFIHAGKLPGILGNRHASGTEIITELGEEHLRSGKPIIYTSGDSVFQIAAHEEGFGLQCLYDLCDLARKLVDPYNIARVIARPFLGSAGNFYRTGNRRDLAIPPPAPTLLDHVVSAAGGEVVAIGKIGDIFGYQGVTRCVKVEGNMALFDATLTAAQEAQPGALVFTNFVDFDMLYGHRRDVPGYAAALEAFDKRLPEFRECMQSGDIAIIAADHGCDPTIPGSDHTREHIPVLMFGPEVAPEFIGRRDSFADIGQTIASHLNLEPLKHGVSFLSSKIQEKIL